MRARMMKRVRYVCHSLGDWVGFSVGNVFSIFDEVDFGGDVFSTSCSPEDAGGGVDRSAKFLFELNSFLLSC